MTTHQETNEMVHMTCRRYQGKAFQAPTEADLPEHRVQLTRPFSSVGIDFCGPRFVKAGKNEMKKCYVASSHAAQQEPYTLSWYLICQLQHSFFV